MVPLIRKGLHIFLRQGNVTVVFPDGSSQIYGDGDGRPLTVRLRSRKAVRRILMDPELAFAEAYLDGEIDVEGDLLDLMRVAHLNHGNDKTGLFFPAIRAAARHVFSRIQQFNTRIRARTNVERHYDISEDIYRLFLDDDMQYSCAYFETGTETLEEAQLAKKRHIAAKLLLKDGQRVLDIGCGWGGMALYLARCAGARVDGITLSSEQLRVAKDRAALMNARKRPNFALRDYRDVGETYDRIVSVGMFEHVGLSHYRTYFRKAAQCLKEDGVMLLHTIGRVGPPRSTDPFIARHIFPGGYIPSLSEIVRPAERSGLVVTDVEVLRLHYADTLKEWRKRFEAERSYVLEVMDERFYRMWTLYLAGSEASFRFGDIAVFQLQLAHRQDAVPLTRSYIGEAEGRLRSREKVLHLDDGRSQAAE